MYSQQYADIINYIYAFIFKISVSDMWWINAAVDNPSLVFTIQLGHNHWRHDNQPWLHGQSRLLGSGNHPGAPGL